MKVLEVLDTFQITGRGTVFVIKCPQWLSELSTEEVLKHNFDFVENNITKSYTVRGIEQRAINRRPNSVAEPNEMIAMLVKEI